MDHRCFADPQPVARISQFPSWTWREWEESQDKDKPQAGKPLLSKMTRSATKIVVGGVTIHHFAHDGFTYDVIIWSSVFWLRVARR